MSSNTTTLFGLWYAQIAPIRAALGLLPLSDGAIVFGHEVLPTKSAPPRITADIQGLRTEPARHFGASLTTDAVPGNNPATMWHLTWLRVEFHLWGNPDVTGADRGADFDACFELMRELDYAMLTVGEGIPNVKILGAEFKAPTDLLRNGRLLVLTAEIAWNIMTDQPFTELTFATPTQSGVAIDAVVEEVNPATGTPTVAGTVIAPPP